VFSRGAGRQQHAALQQGTAALCAKQPDKPHRRRAFVRILLRTIPVRIRWNSFVTMGKAGGSNAS
jgi:hypothetical protein